MQTPRLPPGQHLAAPAKWPVVGERAAAPWSGAWTIEVAGLVEHPQTLTLADLPALGTIEQTVDIHCVTRWSKLDQTFTGVPLAALLRRAVVRPAARFISFVARSERHHSTSLPLDEALNQQALIAWQHAGHPLASEHGGPVRVIVSGRYFYKSLKWLARIELLAEDRLGYWEAVAGYHNGADPWREERYIAPTLSRQHAAAAIALRDFSGQDLRSLDVRAHDLSGLQASAALLRDADFRGARLQRANFAGANLSNARLAGADLRQANFRDADVEGADFSGADLREADFRGASLLGVTFFTGEAESTGATIDATTQFDRERLDDLFPEQAAYVRNCVAAS